MKKILLFALPLVAMCIVSCNRDEIDVTAGAEDTPQSVGEAVNVSFAFKGDITIEESPLLKAAGEETESTDLYGINVYYDKERDGNIDDVYGYGLFDNIADMNISLLTGYKYKFVCSLVKDGKNEVAYNNYIFYYNTSSYSSYTKGYCLPFCESSQSYREDSFDYSYPSSSYFHDPTPVENEFILGGSSHLTGLGKGGTHNFKVEKNTTIYGDRTYSWRSSNTGYKQYPETDRYYGETTDYVPTEGGVVSIEMKRCGFGMKLNVTGVTDGALSVFFDDDSESSTYYSSAYILVDDITSDYSAEELIYTFEDIYQCWSDAMLSNTYYKDMYMHIIWERGNGVMQTLETQQVSFKRNVLTTININLNGASDENGFNLDIESGEMTDENADFEFDAGDMEDTPVEPTE